MNLINRLRSGDSIIVNSNLGKVSLSGSVAKPAIYEIKGNETLKILLIMEEVYYLVMGLALINLDM